MSIVKVSLSFFKIAFWHSIGKLPKDGQGELGKINLGFYSMILQDDCLRMG